MLSIALVAFLSSAFAQSPAPAVTIEYPVADPTAIVSTGPINYRDYVASEELRASVEAALDEQAGEAARELRSRAFAAGYRRVTVECSETTARMSESARAPLPAAEDPSGFHVYDVRQSRTCIVIQL